MTARATVQTALKTAAVVHAPLLQPAVGGRRTPGRDNEQVKPECVQANRLTIAMEIN
ncbi:MAG: hypothetical protein ACPLRM_02935 [Anaerolineae bacterium]